MKAILTSALIALSGIATGSTTNKFCGNVISISGPWYDPTPYDWVQSLVLESEYDIDNAETAHNESQIIITNGTVLAAIEISLKKSLADYISNPAALKKSQLALCLEEYTVRKSTRGTLRIFLESVEKISVSLKNKPLFSGTLQQAIANDFLPALEVKLVFHEETTENFWVTNPEEIGWVEADEEDEEDWYGFKLIKTFKVESLPWRFGSGNFDLSISRNGLVNLDYTGGDADFGADTKMSIPKVKGKFVQSDLPYYLTLSGGESASGSWGMNAQVEIKVLD